METNGNTVKRAVSAYIPCYNNEATILQAIESIKAQSLPVAELFVIDDGSTDGSAALIADSGVTLLQNRQNSGRGAVRAQALQYASNELILTCDANKALAANFLEQACLHIDADNVAAVHGILIQQRAETLAERWRGRHLLKSESAVSINNKALHFTGGALLKKSYVLRLGNYNSHLKYSEDKELGQRLLAAGYDVISDPQLLITATGKNTAAEVLERYWRWHENSNDNNAWLSYLRQIAYSIKVMAKEDLQAGDLASALLSLYSPHYQFWRSWHLRRQKHG